MNNIKNDSQVNNVVMRILNDLKVNDLEFERIYNIIEYAYNMGYLQGSIERIEDFKKELTKK